MDNKILKNILELGVMAPSGSNSQPWTFKIENNSILINMLPEKDHAILNFRNRGTLIAHGALLENITIASRSFGYEPIINLFPKKDEINPVATINFTETQKKDGLLSAVIPSRVTNRKAYFKQKLTEEEKDILIQAATGFPEGSLSFTEDPEALRQMARAVSMNEVVMLEEESLHNLFIHEIAWTDMEEKKRGGGLFLKTMELKAPQEFILTHLIRHWNMARIMNRVGFSHLIANDNAKIYGQAAAFGAIIIPNTDTSFITAGRIMERVWLEATRLNLQFQLMTGILFMHQRINTGDTFGISAKHVKLVEQAYNDIVLHFPTHDVIALLFRIGHGNPPSAHSIKNPPIYI